MQVISFILFLFITLNGLAQPAWTEYPLMRDPTSISSDGENLYVTAQGSILRLNMSSGQQQFITPATNGWFYPNLYYGDINVHSIAANPNRSEVYYALNTNQEYYRFQFGSLDTVSLTTVIQPCRPKLGNNGMLLFRASPSGARLIDSGGAILYSGPERVDIDADNSVWNLLTVNAGSVYYFKVMKVIGTDTTVINLQSEIGQGAVGGFCVAGNKAFLQFKYNNSSVDTAHYIGILDMSDSSFVAMPMPGSITQYSQQCATSNALYILRNFSGASILYKVNEAGYSVINGGTLGIGYEKIIMLGTDFNNNIYLIGYSGNRKYASYSNVDGIIWTTLEVAHESVRKLGSQLLTPGGDLFDSSDSAFYAFNTNSRVLRKFRNATVVAEYDWSAQFPHAFQMSNGSFAVSPNGTMWYAYINDTTDQLKLFRGIGSTVDEFVHPVLFTFNNGSDWIGYNRSFATNYAMWLKSGDTIIRADHAGITYIQTPFDFTQWLLNSDGNPVIWKNNYIYVYNGSTWTGHNMGMEVNSVVQRSDGIYFFTSGVTLDNNIYRYDGNTISVLVNLPFQTYFGLSRSHFDRYGMLYGIKTVVPLTGLDDDHYAVLNTYTGSLSQLTPPIGSYVNTLGESLGDHSFYPADSFLVVANADRYLFYNPAGVAGSLAPSGTSNNIIGFVWYDYNNDSLLNGADQVKLSYPLTLNDVQALHIGSNFQLLTDTGQYFVSTSADPNFHLDADTIEANFSTYLNTENIVFRLFPDSGTTDLGVTLTTNTPRTGFSHVVWVKAQNIAANPVIANLVLTLDTALAQNATSNVPTSGSSTSTISWNIALEPGEVFSAAVTTLIPATYGIGTLLSYALSGNTGVVETSFENNIDSFSLNVSAAYDPNEKQVYPPGQGLNHVVDTGVALTYTVFFQNTGNDTAFNVIVRDTLDSSLDLSSLQVLSSSDSVSVYFHENGVLRFIFPNIMLPDSNTNEPMSHGFIKFRVSPFDEAGYGTVITNRASIYFDYNPPIVTNATLTTLGNENYIVGAPLSQFVSDTTCSSVVTFNADSSANESSWQWDFGDGEQAFGQTVSHQYNAAGFYNVTLVAANYFDADTSTQQILINDSVVTIQTSGSLIVGANVQLSVTGFFGAAAYSWIIDDSLSFDQPAPLCTFGTAGTHHATVTVTDVRGCQTQGSHTFLVGSNVVEILEVSGINVFPNPSTGLLTVMLDHQPDVETILSVSDAVGRILIERSVNDIPYTLDCSHLAAGIYSLKIESDSLKLARKLIIIN